MAAANDSIKIIFNGMDDASFNREYVENSPYSMITAKIGIGPRSLLVLGKVDGNKRYWYSADRAVLITENGRLTSTGGLPVDLIATQFPQGDALTTLQPQSSGRISYRLTDYSHGNYYGIPIQSKFRYVGQETLDIMGSSRITDHYVEEIQSDVLDWEETNEFWIGESGTVWQSKQHFVPDQPPVIIQLLK